MSLLNKVKVLAAKVETTSGTAESLTATEAALNVFNLQFSRTTEFIEREGQAAFTPLTGSKGGAMGQCTFRTEIYGGASAPLWATTFLPACGFVGTLDVYDPVSEVPGSNVKTITIGAYENGRKKVLRGCAGTFVITLEAGKPCYIDWTFTGIWDAVTDVTILAPTYPTTAPIRYVSATSTIGGYAHKHGTLTIDIGNEVFMREDPTDASGYCGAVITGRRVTGTIDAEAELVATADPYGDLDAFTTGALDINLGSGSNDVNIDAPALQWTGVTDGNRNGLLTDQMTFQLVRSAAAGDDEISIDVTP